MPSCHASCLNNVQLHIEFRPESFDGIVLLTGERDDLTGDFMAVLIHQGFIEFWYVTIILKIYFNTFFIIIISITRHKCLLVLAVYSFIREKYGGTHLTYRLMSSQFMIKYLMSCLVVRISFRFDCGSGTGVVRSEETVILNQWNTVLIYRHRWDSWLILNQGNRVQGRSKVNFTFK